MSSAPAHPEAHDAHHPAEAAHDAKEHAEKAADHANEAAHEAKHAEAAHHGADHGGDHGPKKASALGRGIQYIWGKIAGTGGVAVTELNPKQLARKTILEPLKIETKDGVLNSVAGIMDWTREKLQNILGPYIPFPITAPLSLASHGLKTTSKLLDAALPEFLGGKPVHN